MTVRENPPKNTNAGEAQESPVPGDSKVEQGPSMGVRSECSYSYNNYCKLYLTYTRNIVCLIDVHVCTTYWPWFYKLLMLFIAPGEMPTGVCDFIEGNDRWLKFF